MMGSGALFSAAEFFRNLLRRLQERAGKATVSARQPARGAAWRDCNSSVKFRSLLCFMIAAEEDELNAQPVRDNKDGDSSCETIPTRSHPSL
jgi:hypothetical protein